MIVLDRKVVAGAVAAAAISTSTLFFPQFSTVDDVPQNYFTEHKYIYGRVERVIDGDTVRLSHCRSRFLGCRDIDPSARRIYDSTLSVRLYGVDSPELQKRKSDPPSQPFAEDAKQFTSDLVLDKVVRVKLLSRDRYGRAIGRVEARKGGVPFFPMQDVSKELASRGLATIYRGGGAQYDNNKEHLEAAARQAQRSKQGIWSLGDDIVFPEEFKKNQRASSSR